MNSITFWKHPFITSLPCNQARDDVQMYGCFPEHRGNRVMRLMLWKTRPLPGLLHLHVCTRYQEREGAFEKSISWFGARLVQGSTWVSSASLTLVANCLTQYLTMWREYIFGKGSRKLDNISYPHSWTLRVILIQPDHLHRVGVWVKTEASPDEIYLKEDKRAGKKASFLLKIYCTVIMLHRTR